MYQVYFVLNIVFLRYFHSIEYAWRVYMHVWVELHTIESRVTVHGVLNSIPGYIDQYWNWFLPDYVTSVKLVLYCEIMTEKLRTKIYVTNNWVLFLWTIISHTWISVQKSSILFNSFFSYIFTRTRCFIHCIYYPIKAGGLNLSKASGVWGGWVAPTMKKTLMSRYGVAIYVYNPIFQG